MITILPAVAGWIGASALLIAYILLSKGQVQARDQAFAWLNVIGSTGLLINGVAKTPGPLRY